MTENNSQPSTDNTNNDNQKSRWTVERVIKISLLAFLVFVLVLFVIGVLIALFGDVVYWAALLQIARDLVIVIIAVQGILIITAIALLVLQVARLINLIKSESSPILENTRETLKEAKVTTQFVSKHSVDPIIKTKSFFSGLIVFFSELFKINKLIKPKK